jgi:acetyl esterase/lipase
MGAAAVAATLTWPELLDRPKPPGDARIDYGTDKLQHVDLWLPKGKGPFPVVVMVHGGCWRSKIAAADIMNWIANDLRGRGIAVWNIEYRGADRSPFPATFQDVAAGADALRASAAQYKLDLKRVIAVGHSAGGHLALWLAARPGISPASPLHSADPLTLKAAISLGGLPDLEAASVPPGNTCGSEIVSMLVGEPTAERPNVYADTSPAVLPQPGIKVTLVNGTVDRIAPPSFAEAYGLRAGGKPRQIVVEGAGHIELIAPETEAWKQTVAVIEASLH